MHRSTFTGRVPHILLVDDNSHDLQLMGEAFAECGVPAHLRHAHDGEEALAALLDGDDRPDLLLLDLNMPRMDGRALLARLADMPQAKDVRIVVLTSSSRDADLEFCSQMGALSYVIKPTTWDQYLTLVRSLKVFCCQPVSDPEPVSH
jgi:CheY-like chemotaxis protein